MRILWLKSDLLLPLDKGGKLRTWHLMRHLARRHAITYLAFKEPDQPAADVEGMREVAASVETVNRAEPAKGTLRFYADAAMHLVDPLPYAVGISSTLTGRNNTPAAACPLVTDATMFVTPC